MAIGQSVRSDRRPRQAGALKRLFNIQQECAASFWYSRGYLCIQAVGVEKIRWREAAHEKSMDILCRIGNWFGLTGAYEVKPGEARPFWFTASKSEYLAFSIPNYLAGVALFFLLLYNGVYWSLAAIVPTQFVALAMLVSEDSPSRRMMGISRRRKNKGFLRVKCSRVLTLLLFWYLWNFLPGYADYHRFCER